MATEGQTEEVPVQSENKHKTKTLYIWGLDKSLSQSEVKEKFANCAEVNRVTIIKDKATGTSKGFGYVECGTPEDATRAMKEMDGTVIGENPVRIKYSFSETPDWLKYLDSKGELSDRERPRQNRGPPPDGFRDGFRGRGRGRGRGGRGGSHFDFGEDSHRGGYGRYGDDGPPPRGGERFSYEERRPPPPEDPYQRRPYDDPYAERRPANVPPYDRRHPPEDSYDRRPPYDDPYQRRPRSPPPAYDRRPPLDPYERVPRSEDPYDSRPPVDRALIDERRLPPRREQYGDRGDIYSPPSRRDLYEVPDRRDLYRPSDRLEPPLGREPRGRSPDPLGPPPVSYRARSPIDRLGPAERDPYYSAPPLRKDEVRGIPDAKPPTDYGAPYSYETARDPVPRSRADPYMDPYSALPPRR